jgi:hypothetical protein
MSSMTSFTNLALLAFQVASAAALPQSPNYVKSGTYKTSGQVICVSNTTFAEGDASCNGIIQNLAAGGRRCLGAAQPAAAPAATSSSHNHLRQRRHQAPLPARKLIPGSVPRSTTTKPPPPASTTPHSSSFQLFNRILKTSPAGLRRRLPNGPLTHPSPPMPS